MPKSRVGKPAKAGERGRGQAWADGRLNLKARLGTAR